jgi:diaminohydroxyphosphoribosylaminopyrimidine deaminase / 5-amino-6-(5-phosphoribosylamino)uracil reductase
MSYPFTLHIELPMSPLIISTHMSRALALAQEAIGLSEPNPRVGCVLVSRHGEVLGEGFTQAAGQSHAEVMALRAAQSCGLSVAGATAFVTLEPCSHFGRTPPCCEALIAAGVQKVVVAHPDTNPQVSGQGLARLRAAGLEVLELPTHDPLRQAARELNIGFFSRMERQRPWVRLKAALSLDGMTALPNGVSQWITGAAARHDGHVWRQRASALLTGIGTVLLDDPQLTVRNVPIAHPPLRIVLDSQLRIPATARMLRAPGPIRIYTLESRRQGVQNWREAVQSQTACEVTVEVLPQTEGRMDLQALMQDLNQLNINELHVEAGSTLNTAFLQGGWVDELLIYLAPKLLGQGHGLSRLGPWSAMTDSELWQFNSITTLGEDIRLIARRPA